jgi:hypothetical protein
MDETRIPKGVERILLLESGKSKVLFKRKSKKKKGSRFRKSLRKAVVAVVDCQRDGAEAVVNRVLRLKRA